MDYYKFRKLINDLEHDTKFDSTIDTAIKAVSTEYASTKFGDEFLSDAKTMLQKAKTEDPNSDPLGYGKTCFSAGMAVAALILETTLGESELETYRCWWDDRDRMEKAFDSEVKKHSKGGKHSHWKPHEELILEHLEKYKIREFTSQEQCCQSISDKTGLTLKQVTFSKWWIKFKNGDPIFIS